MSKSELNGIRDAHDSSFLVLRLTFLEHANWDGMAGFTSVFCMGKLRGHCLHDNACSPVFLVSRHDAAMRFERHEGGCPVQVRRWADLGRDEFCQCLNCGVVIGQGGWQGDSKALTDLASELD